MEVALRWIAHHSALGPQDGIILGASKVEQIQETVTTISKGPLHAEVLETVEDLWITVQRGRHEIL